MGWTIIAAHLALETQQFCSVSLLQMSTLSSRATRGPVAFSLMFAAVVVVGQEEWFRPT